MVIVWTLEHKREDYQNCSVLPFVHIVHSHMHTGVFLLFVVVWLSVSVQLNAWKDSPL